MLLLDSMIAGLKRLCEGFPDARKGRTGNIVFSDFVMSAFALFFMQSASFLDFQRRMEDRRRRSNCETLFGIGRIPSDASIRSHLDGVDPALLLPAFECVEAHLLRPEMREKLERLGGRTLIAVDGTEYFCSQKLKCPNCSTRKRSNGAVENFHSMLSATAVSTGKGAVAIPLMPEFVAPQDGAEKQDCERNAFRRWHAAHGARLKPLRPVYLGDDLYACGPIVDMLRAGGDDFILTAKPASHKALYDFMAGAETREMEKVVRRGQVRQVLRYRWFNGAPLSGQPGAPTVDWIGFEIADGKGKVTYSTAFVTSLPVSRDNVVEIVEAGRARWKIENETFNVLKNNGYEFEHNFGHGKEFLAMTLAALNLLAFAWHGVLDVAGGKWKDARRVFVKRTTFFQEMLSATRILLLPSWDALLLNLVSGDIPPDSLQERKNE